MNDLRGKKTARRGNGEGTIYRRKNGTWAAALTMGVKPDGKPDRRFRYGRTRAEALEKLCALQSQALKPPTPTPTSITVGGWLEFWLENYARPNIRQSTYENYRLQIQTHLIPGLGAIPLEKLAASDVQLFLKGLLSNGRCPKGPSAAGGTAGPGLAPSSIVYIRNILKAALEQAVLEQKIPLNPAKQTKIPKVPKREMNVLSREEVSRFLTSASRCRDYPAYLFVKRLMDVVLSSCSLAALSPVFLAVAIAIRLDSKGPVFFVHKRIGRNGSELKLYKFRSMVTNAEELMARFTPEQKREFAENFKLDHDPRITRVGSFLRRTSLDELP